MVTLSVQAIYKAALKAGFSPHQATTWTAIALAESGGNPQAHNPVGEDSRGLWQINLNAHTNTWGDLGDPEVNARAAYEVSRQGTDMRPWTVTHASNAGTNRDYRHYLGQVEQVTGVRGDPRGVEGYEAALPEPLEEETLTASGAAEDYDVMTSPPLPGAQQDTDSDGLVDAYERFIGTDPDVADTDADGLSDAYELGHVDSDPLLVDTDVDGLPDSVEAVQGTSAQAWDSDLDGISDRVEVELGADPLRPDAGDGVAPASAQPETLLQATSGPVLPVQGETTAEFGHEGGPHSAPHGGHDIGVPSGTPVAAPTDGRVEAADWHDTYGNYVKIQNTDGTSTILAHLEELDVASGDVVTAGMTVGKAGSTGYSTGPHVHWEIRDSSGQRIDPLEWFERARSAATAGDVVFGAGGAGTAALAQPYDAIDIGEPVEAPPDADADGLSDAFETLAGTDPESADTDMDGLSDAYEGLVSRTDPLSVDTDVDGVPDAVEVGMGSHAGQLPGVAGVTGHGEFAELVRDGVQDADMDGLSDAYESKVGTDPTSVDTDGDQLPDSVELSLGTDPTMADSDMDGFSDSFEIDLRGDEPGGPGLTDDVDAVLDEIDSVLADGDGMDDVLT
jgi:murein DD-endopeptidase MepM/ murein hydrolase activator NlpD